jgi:hypothetical protein
MTTEAEPAQEAAATPPAVAPAPLAVAASDPDLAVIATAISAHIDSVVSDARRNVARVGTNH